MRKNKKVIKPKNLPSRVPLFNTMTMILVLDKIEAPEWAWGVMICLMTLVWISALWGMAEEDEVDLFKEK